MALESPAVGEKRKVEQASLDLDLGDSQLALESPAVGEKRKKKVEQTSLDLGDSQMALEPPEPPSVKVEQTSLVVDIRVSDPIGLTTMDPEDPCMSMQKYPSGVRFFPRDAELVADYLMSRVRNLNVPAGGFVNEVDLYRYHPKDLVAEYRWSGEDTWYFLTRLNRKYPNGKRPDRTAGPGYWKTTGSDCEVKDSEGEVIGRRSSLIYLERNLKGDKKTSWKMQEYKLPESKEGKVVESNDEGWVLCKVYAR